MIDFDSFRKQLDDLSNKFKDTKNIPSQIQNVAKTIKDSESKKLVQDFGAAVSTALEDAKNGKLTDFKQFINRAENIANGNESTGN